MARTINLDEVYAQFRAQVAVTSTLDESYFRFYSPAELRELLAQITDLQPMTERENTLLSYLQWCAEGALPRDSA